MVGGQHGPVCHLTQQIAANIVFSQARAQANVSG
jgi:hypothetical protein